MASRKDYEEAVRILKYIRDEDTARSQARHWANYFEVDNRAFNRQLFFDALGLEDN